MKPKDKALELTKEHFEVRKTEVKQAKCEYEFQDAMMCKKSSFVKSVKSALITTLHLQRHTGGIVGLINNEKILMFDYWEQVIDELNNLIIWNK